MWLKSLCIFTIFCLVLVLCGSAELILMEVKNVELYIWLVTFFLSVKIYTQVTHLFQQS